MSSSTPSIRISHHQRFHNPPSHSSSSDSPSPMAIPRAQESVPPPLPPPSYIPEISAGHDPGWQWGNDPNASDFGRSAQVQPGSSLLGGGTRDFRQQEEEQWWLPHDVNSDTRRGSSISTVTLGRNHTMPDESAGHSDEEGTSPRPPSNYRLQGERQLEQRTLERSSQTYDKQLLSRIGGPNTPKRRSVSYASGVQEPAPPVHTDIEFRDSLQKSLTLPERKQTSLESPASARWPLSGAISPGFAGGWSEHGPLEGNRPLPTRHSSIAFDDSVSHRGSYDHSMFLNEDLMEESQMSSLNIHDRSPSRSEDYQLGLKAGTKRRASSPPRDGVREERSSVSSASGQNEIYHRRSVQQLPNRSSPVSRYNPNHSSVSSASSFGPRHGSLGSSLGVASIPSSATSYGSGRLSPSALSPTAEPDIRIGTPFGSGQVLATNHQRALSESTQSARKSSTESIPHSRHSSMSRMQGMHICECCPKKPKKFDTAEELRLHESEKQYTCAYCPNRFKNKNEAERHQNSLHLRRHSWSCSVLAGVEAAFHSTSSASGTDTCGYCGREFSNPPQWDVRAEHLNVVHKFGECNQTKKFFRADHFRQHLKHSHAGTSGKWTNMLETACMKDEPLPEKRVSPSAQAPPALMVTTTGLTGPQDARGIIEETPHDR